MKTMLTKAIFKQLCTVCFMAICTSILVAQSPDKPENKVVIIKKTIDENGNEKIEKIVKEGDELNMKEIKDLIKEGVFDGNTDIDIDIDIQQDGRTEDIFIFREAHEGGSEEIEILEEDGTLYINGEKIEGDVEENTDGSKKRIIVKRFSGDSGDETDVIVEEIENDFSEEPHIFMKKIVKANGPFLGVRINTDQKSCIVESVFEGSPAEKAGIKPGDQLLAINGVKFSGYKGLVEELDKYKTGDEVRIQYLRKSQTFSTSAKLASASDFESERHVWTGKSNCHIPKKKCCQGGKPKMGVMIENTEQGVKVTEVVNESPAAKAGIKAEDIIISVDGQNITDVEGLIHQITSKKPGDVVDVDLKRNDSKISIEIPISKTDNCCLKAKKIKKHKIVIVKPGQEDITIKNEEDAAVELRGLENTLSLSEFQLYPNPTSGQINISFKTDLLEALNVSITDLGGKSVFEEKVEDFNGSYSKDIDITDHNEGIYILRISQGNRIYTEKVVINKK